MLTHDTRARWKQVMAHKKKGLSIRRVVYSNSIFNHQASKAKLRQNVPLKIAGNKNNANLQMANKKSACD